MTPTKTKALATLTISYLLCVGLLAALTACRNSAPPQAVSNGHVIFITASRFHFTPKHITLIKGQPVTLRLASTDIRHGFMIRALNIDTDITPGQITAITVTPAAGGTFKAICDHYCGFGHGDMKMTIVVEEPSAAKSTGPKVAIPAKN